MILNQTPELYLNRDKAIDAITDSLNKGYLTLFIGAGISKSATKEFPRWNELVETCCKKKGIAFNRTKAGFTKKKEIDNEYLLKRIEEVKVKCGDNNEEYLNLISDSLYEKVVYNNKLLNKELLVSIGSIIMGSIRGNANSVINYNFDDLFEWYLDYHGYKTQVISIYPSLIYKSDVKIFHPHGFLPLLPKYKTSKTKDIVFSYDEYETVISSEVNPWNEFQRYILSTSLGLFIGMSGDDKHVTSLCSYVYKKNELVNKQRILAFIILEDNIINKSKQDENLRRGLVNLYINKYSDLPDFLLSICQKAADL